MDNFNIETEISYAVYCRSDFKPNKFVEFSCWSDYETAYETYIDVLKNPSCRCAIIVEKVETLTIKDVVYG